MFKNWLDEQGHTLETLRKETIDTRQNAKDENFADTKSIEELQLAAEQEILADFIGDMLYAEDGGIERMLQDLSAQEKFDFIEWIRDVIRKLINKVKGIDTSFEDELRSLEQKFTKMLNETTKNEKNTGEDVKYSAIIKETVNKAIENKGKIDEPRNQKRISKVPKELAEMVYAATNGKIDISNKYVAINGSDTYHEYMSHSDERIEAESRGQKALTPEIISEMIEAIYTPDIIEGLITETNDKIQNQSFAYAKKKDGYYVVAEVVGGRKNPNITPVMMLYITESRWDKYINEGKSIGEMLYENNPEFYNALDTENKNNRVIAAQFAQKRAIAHTPHSPRSNNTVPQTQQNVNKKLSVAPETDAEYMSAVENGDMKTAQKMVDKAAKDAGYLLKGYHGSPNRFYIFERSKIGKTTDPGIYGRGFYFSDQESQAWEYANQNNKKGDVRSFFIKINNPFEIKSDADYLAFEDIYMGPLAKAEANGEILTEERIGELLEEGTQKLIDMGYDGVIYYGKGQKEYVTFESEQSKLSDAVVYDDQGNVIPLSERFNEKKKDIRWSTSSQSNKKSLPKYTKEQYNNFGWTRYDNILSAKQIKMLDEKLYELSKRNVYFNKTRDGQYIIPIGEDYGLYDVLVYTNDDAINPKISKIIKLTEFANAFLKEDVWKEFLNDTKNLTERNINSTIKNVGDIFGEGNVVEYVPRTSPSFQEYEYARVKGIIGGQDSGRNGKRYDIGAVDTESERDTTGNTENDVKLSISKDQKREILEMLKNGQITTEEAMQRLDNTKKKPLEELKDITNIKPKNVSTKVKGKPIKNAPLKDNWSADIDADYKKRGKK